MSRLANMRKVLAADELQALDKYRDLPDQLKEKSADRPSGEEGGTQKKETEDISDTEIVGESSGTY